MPAGSGVGSSGDEAGYQLAQRSDYIEVEVGLETTLKRGIINTRDEPHADADKYRRLHVIIGDANMSEYSTLLKVGTTALVLDMIEKGVRFDELRLSEPVRSVHRISHDPTLKTTVELTDGRKMTGLDVQRAYFEKAAKHVENTLGADVDADTAEVLAAVGQVLDDAGPRPAELRRPPRLAGQAAAAGGLPRARRAGLGLRAAAAGRPAVHRRADGQGPLQPARRARVDEAAGRRGRRARRAMTHPAGGHPRLLPRPLPGALPHRGGRGVVGLGDLRPGPRVAGAHPHAGAAARHPPARRASSSTTRARPRSWWRRSPGAELER